MNLWMKRTDLDQHARLRRIAHQAFTPRRIADMRTSIHMSLLTDTVDYTAIRSFAALSAYRWLSGDGSPWAFDHFAGGKGRRGHGAAGGLGRCLVDRYLQAGARVVATDVNRAGLASLKRHEQLTTVEADVSSPGGAHRARDAASGTVDILCNNAGVMDRLGLVHEVEMAQWDRLIAVNRRALFCVARPSYRA